MTRREMTVSEMARLGGQAGTGKAKVRGSSKHYATMAALAWAGMTKAERSAEMSRRRRKGARKK